MDLDWADPDLKILDPVCGRGTFLLGLLEQLEAAGHSREHIVKNMLYGCDIKPSQARIASRALKMVSGVDANIYNDDCLSREWTMKFDLILMNPPYQKDTNFVKDDKNKQGSFYYRFIELGLDLAKPNGQIMVICPKSIFGSGGFGTRAFKVGEILKTASFTEIWPDLNEYFSSVSIEILGFALVKNTTRPPVRITGTDHCIDIDGVVPVPFYVSKTAMSVMKKCFNVTDQTIGFKESIADRVKDTDTVLKVNGGRFKQWNKTYVGKNSGTQHCQQGAIIKPEEVKGYTSARDSLLWEYLFKVLGGERGNSVTGLVDRLPIMPDMTQYWPNQAWWDHWGITPEEQADIVKFLKDYNREH